MNNIPFFFKPRFRFYLDSIRFPFLRSKFKGDIQKIGDQIGANQVILQSKEFRYNLTGIQKTKNPLKIAFITLGGSYGMYVDYVLAEALRACGHQVVFYVDDACLPCF